jgi:hypothetical protein
LLLYRFLFSLKLIFLKKKNANNNNNEQVTEGDINVYVI